MVVDFPLWLYPIILWELVWKGIGWWKAARKNQVYWFISFFLFNTAGILPMVYLIWFSKDKPSQKLNLRKETTKKSSKKSSKKKRK